MAKHIYNNTLELLLTKCKHHRNIDLLFALIDLSQQIKIGKGKYDYKFIIPCHHNAAHAIWNEVNLKFPNLINKTTVNDCVKELKLNNIIKYNDQLNGFELIDMEKMLLKKDKGYTDLRNFFFTKAFINMPFNEKRALIYMIYLMDKKSVSNKFKKDYGTDIICNLNNYRKVYNMNELNWMTVCNTTNIYYVKRILDSLAINYPDIIESKTNEFRLAKYGKEKGIAKGVCVDVIYFLNLKDSIKRNNYNEQEELNTLIERNTELNNKIDTIAKEKNITISISNKIALLRRLFNLLPYAQENLINKVIDRIKYSITNNNPIRNIEAFVQYLLNQNIQYKYCTVANKRKYQRGVIDYSAIKDISLPF